MVWKPGQSGNPQGAQRGAKQHKNKLAVLFFRALATSFETEGVKAIERVIKEDPAKYLTIVSSIMPKELEVTNFDKDLTDDQLADIISALRSGISAGIIREVAATTSASEQAQDVSSVH